jgi:hypothetical protein
LGRVINPNTAGKERTRLTKAVGIALRELAGQEEGSPVARDIAAFISLALVEVSETIEVTVIAWEKRDYWVKADKFRMDWRWAASLSKQMKAALFEEDWGKVADTSIAISMKLFKVKVPKTNNIGKPWRGAWQKLQEQD